MSSSTNASASRYSTEGAHPTVITWGPGDNGTPRATSMRQNVTVECGWGRLIFAHTFRGSQELADALCEEREGKRDIAFYLHDPHVVLSLAPQEVFLDPSHSYRLNLEEYSPSERAPNGFSIRNLRTREDGESINRIFESLNMAKSDVDFLCANVDSSVLTVLVATDGETGDVVGTATGIDHRSAFDDPEEGSSLWCLAVDPQARYPGIGEALVRHLAERYKNIGLKFMDLSVMHNNTNAIGLYEKLGFYRIPVFTLKRKNPINERLFIGPAPTAKLNPYATIIVDEARRRGIAVEVLDGANGYFSLTHGGRTIVCRESLSELTTAIAMSRCDDKNVTRRVLEHADLRVPDYIPADSDDEALYEFLSRHGSVVVKPARGEQGRGISVGLTSITEVRQAVDVAERFAEKVIIEKCVTGEDLRIVVIGDEVVAAAVRRPPEIIGDGELTVEELIEKQSRRRSAATGGESTIPIDLETARCLRATGMSLKTVPENGRSLTVRKTANLHTGGTIHDVTDILHPELARAAIRAARAIDIPVVGLDFIVPDVEGPEYTILEANERPGLANHEPQPTAQRFIDLLFPLTVPPGARTKQNSEERSLAK